MTKRLYRSDTNKVWSGLIGGIGDYFDIDPVMLRVTWILIVVFTGFFPGLIAYIFASVIVPRHGETRGQRKHTAHESSE